MLHMGDKGTCNQHRWGSETDWIPVLTNLLEDMVDGVAGADGPLSKDHARFILGHMAGDDAAHEVFGFPPGTSAEVRKLFE